MFNKLSILAIFGCLFVISFSEIIQASPTKDVVESNGDNFIIASSRNVGKVEVQLAQAGLLGKDVSVSWWACAFPCNHLGCQNYHNWCVCYSGCVCYCYT